ncbi:MAG TPA: hypothetical protein DCY10_00535 [Clostridiales bacterium]|jgi:hypothetical protein|nr:hypothetical protein [Clostridiales bacterium]
MKKDLLLEIQTQLGALGISAATGDKTDLVIDAELVDAAFSTGKKKLRYEAMILLDEGDKQVKMYEKTTETSAGVSFGMSGETSFQSGSTLMRKVKCVQYDPTGKVLEYNFDLGAISKAVKAAALSHGWGFKTVIMKKNAMYR